MYTYVRKPGATKAILELLAQDGGQWLLIDECVEELSPLGYTRGQIRGAMSDLFTHKRGVQSDGRNPARYALNATAAIAVKQEWRKKSKGEPLRRYHPEIRPLTPKAYDLMAHYRMNAR